MKSISSIFHENFTKIGFFKIFSGAAVARKMRADEVKALRGDAVTEGEKTGGQAGEDAGGNAGEAAGASEAEKIGAEEGERIGREIAGDEGAKIGRELGAEVARNAGARLGRKVGKTAGAVAGKKAGLKACSDAVNEVAKEMSREKVTKLRAMFMEIATKAGSEAGAKVAKIEAIKAVRMIAAETAQKSVKEKLLAMASKGTIKLSADWKPTALISVIANRSDLSDLDKIRLAAKAKMEGNLGEMLPKKFSASALRRESTPDLGGKLKFQTENEGAEAEDVDPTRKWSTVVFSELPDEKKKKDTNSTKDNVNSLRKRFETSNMKNNEAYVIM